MITSSDPIADMLTRIRNAIELKGENVSVPYSKAKHSILQVMEAAGWVARVSVEEGTGQKSLVVMLKYDEQRKSILRFLRRVSRPGRRVYVGRSSLPIVANNHGMAIISTSQGMVTNREARRRGLGGEVICEVW